MPRRFFLRLGATAGLVLGLTGTTLLAPAPAAAADYTYTVQPGDTLDAIARRAGATWPALWRLNPALADPNRLRPGMTLRLPAAPAAPGEPGPVVRPGMARPPAGERYRVRPGESLGLIARRHGLTWAELWLLNPHITEPARLRPGALLRLPAWPAPGERPASVTAYGPTGRRTASGKVPARGMAASNTLPFGTRVRLSNGLTVVIEDRIGCCSDLDLFMPTVAEARRFGRQHLRIAW
jgi:LysM repeat protein/3D (Asp-Asp-Asp) domain-containing protein